MQSTYWIVVLHKRKIPRFYGGLAMRTEFLLTHDLDFSELVAASQGDLPSVVVFRLHFCQFYDRV